MSRVCAAFVLQVISVAAIANELGPAPRPLSDAFSRIEPDPPPKKLCADAHFFKSDEEAHWLFKDAITNLGGVMAGVGTDQLYVMAGWARPEVLVPADFDQMVVDLHRLYGVAFMESPTPADFVRAWGKSQESVFEGRIKKTFADPATQARLLKTFRQARPFVEMRLQWLQKTYKKHKVAMFLDDPQQYAYLVSLFQTGRVFPVRGDLTGTKAFKGIGEAARSVGLPVRVLYLSNAEKYFDYNAGFREAMLAQPFDEKSVVLRTAGGWGKRDPEKDPDPLYIFLVQKGLDFQAWLRNKKVVNWKPLLYQRKKSSVRGLYSVPGPR